MKKSSLVRSLNWDQENKILQFKLDFSKFLKVLSSLNSYYKKYLLDLFKQENNFYYQSEANDYHVEHAKHKVNGGL